MLDASQVFCKHGGITKIYKIYQQELKSSKIIKKKYWRPLSELFKNLFAIQLFINVCFVIVVMNTMGKKKTKNN